MRPLPALAAALACGIGVVLISVAGRSILATGATGSALSPSSADHATGPGTLPGAGQPPPEQSAEDRASPPPATPPGAAKPSTLSILPTSQAARARAVAPDVVAPPPLDPAELQRAEPRQPLSELALALPPKPVPPDKWKGTLLHRPVAVSSARFEAMGRTVELAGVEGIEPDEICTWEEEPWPCGIRARTAFRSWLRGRSLSCTIPPESDRHLIVADCRLGKQDVGAWLVANGWAVAREGGPYEAEGKTAHENQLGIFGPPPTGVLPETSFQLPPSAVPEAELPDFNRLELLPPDGPAPNALSPDVLSPTELAPGGLTSGGLATSGED